MIDRDAFIDDLDLAAQTVIGEPRAAAGHFFGRAIEQNAAHGGRGCRVADAHFARRQQRKAHLLPVADEVYADFNRRQRLFTCHRRALREIRRAGSDAPVQNAFHLFPCHADIHRHNLAAHRIRHAADARSMCREVFRHGAGHALIRLADALRNNAVICAKHQYRTPADVDFLISGQCRRVLNHRFQCAQPAERLGKTRPVFMRRCSRRRILRRDCAKNLCPFRFGHFMLHA